MDDFHLFQPRKYGLVDKRIYLLHRLGYRHSQEIDLCFHALRGRNVADDLHGRYGRAAARLALFFARASTHAEELLPLDVDTHTADQHLCLLFFRIDGEYFAARLHFADEYFITDFERGKIDGFVRRLFLLLELSAVGDVGELIFEGARAYEIRLRRLFDGGEFFDFGEQFLRPFGALADDAAAFDLCGREQFFALALQTLPFGIDSRELCRPLRFERFRLFFRLLRLDAALLGSADDIFKLAPALGEEGNGVV